MSGFFIVSTNPDEEFDIKCELHPQLAKSPIPKKQGDLYLEMESTNNIIKSLHKTQIEVKKKYFDKLLSLTQVGLVGETAQPDIALISLEKLKEEIILIEGKRIKNDYMIALGKIVLVFVVILGTFCFFLNKNKQNEISMYIFCFIGALVGTWISFGARKLIITFEQLSLLEEDMMTPIVRLIYIGTCSMIFMLFLNTNIINLSIGSISTSMIKHNYELQLSIGVLCGLIESKIGVNIYKKAVQIMSN